MSSHGLLLGVLLLAAICCGQLNATEQNCLSGDQTVVMQGIREIQTHCTDQNENFLASENEHKHGDHAICRTLYELLKCVATHVTYCYDYFMENYKHYNHSPYSCVISGQQVMELQSIVRAAHQRNRDTTTTSTSPTPTPREATPVYKVGVSSSTWGTSASTGNTPSRKGTKDSHVGSDNGKNGTANQNILGKDVILLLYVMVWLSWLLGT